MRNISRKEIKKLTLGIFVLAIITLITLWLAWCVNNVALGWLFIIPALVLLIAFSFSSAACILTENPQAKKMGKWYISFTAVFFVLLIIVLAISFNGYTSYKWALFAPILMSVFLAIVIAIGIYFLLKKNGYIAGDNTNNPL